jgi:hypothetical protein
VLRSTLLRPTLRRPLATAVALVLGAGLAAAPPTAADAAAKQRQVRGTVVGASTLGSTIHWGYDVNAKGVGYAAWVDGSSTARRVLVAKRSPKGTWGKPRRLTGTFSWTGKKGYAGYPDVAVDKRGRATVVWTQPAGKGVVVRVVTSTGKGWSKPRTLSAKKDHAGFPDVEVSDKGHAVVVWAGRFPLPPKPTFTLLAAYRDRSGTWSKAARLDSTTPGFTLDARPESLAIDDRGVATVAWDEISDGGDRIQVGSRGPTTGWTKQTLASGSNLNAPEVATTGDGRLVAAWRDFDGTLVRRRGVDGTWDATQKVVTGPQGIAHNLYGLGISDGGRVALLGQEVVLSGNKVRPYLAVQDGPGQAWVREYVDKAYPQRFFPVFRPDLEINHRGAVTVTWEEQPRSGSAWPRTFLRTRTAGGTWKPVTRIGRGVSDPVLAVDGKGRFSMVFGDGGGTPACCVALRAARVP